MMPDDHKKEAKAMMETKDLIIRESVFADIEYFYPWSRSRR